MSETPTEQEALRALQDELYGSEAAYRQRAGGDPGDRLRELEEKREALADEREFIERLREKLANT